MFMAELSMQQGDNSFIFVQEYNVGIEWQQEWEQKDKNQSYT